MLLDFSGSTKMGLRRMKLRDGDPRTSETYLKPKLSETMYSRGAPGSTSV